MIHRGFLFVVVALFVGTSTSQAQGVPALSGNIAGGWGTTSSSAGETWFRSTNRPMASADIAVRIGGAGDTRPVIEVGYSFDVGPSDVTSICLRAPNGSCRASFPATFGPSIGVGVRQVLGARWLVGVTAGVASYSGQARYAAVDVSWRFASHVGIVGEFKYLDMAYNSERVWFHPVTFGIRLYR